MFFVVVVVVVVGQNSLYLTIFFFANLNLTIYIFDHISFSILCPSLADIKYDWIWLLWFCCGSRSIENLMRCYLFILFNSFILSIYLFVCSISLQCLNFDSMWDRKENSFLIFFFLLICSFFSVYIFYISSSSIIIFILHCIRLYTRDFRRALIDNIFSMKSIDDCVEIVIDSNQTNYF